MRNGLLGFVFNQVPFVDHYNQSLIVSLYDLENVHILSFNSARSIQKKNADVRIFDGTNGAHDGIKFQILRHLVFLADTSSVNQEEVKAEFGVTRQDAVARCAGNVCDDMAVFPNKGIDDAALSDIWTPNDRDCLLYTSDAADD